MNLDYQTILNRANVLYTEAKVKLREEQGIGVPDGTSYAIYSYAIYSDQVKSILKALVEELNKQ